MNQALAKPGKLCSKRKPLSLGIRQATMAAVMVAAAAPQAYALNFQLDNGMTIDLDTTLTYDAQWRMQDQSKEILEFGGLGELTDDGNRNFDEGDMTQNRVSFGTDFDANYGDGGVFVRARGWYDEIYDDGDLARESFQQDGIDEHKSKIEFLDAFWYHNFALGDRNLSLRVGEQVVNWGESLFLQGGISTAMGPLDATKANAPGTELKDIFMPIGQVYAEMTLTDNLSLGAYYQYDWEATRIDAPGTYFNILDGFGQKSVGDQFGGPVLGVDLPVTEDEPDEGQYGIALRYLAENLNSTEFGFYYLNYNDFTPSLQVFSNPALGGSIGMNHEYFEDIDLYGLSFGTVFGDVNVSGEISYRDGSPVQIVDTFGGFLFAPAETVQTQVSAIYILPQNPLADNMSFTGEIGYNRVLDIDMPNGHPRNSSKLKDQIARKNDIGAASAVVSLKADYFNIIGGLDMSVTGTYRNDFSGRSSTSYTFTEDNEQFALKTDFTYLGKHKFGASYVWFLANPKDIIKDDDTLAFGNLNADRDYLAAYYKYSF
ncbi:hypothetical protein GCM10011348_11890 [Marinobacterium nitratireducens]|uniref:DUF1302 domain-containing protein n=1 Tax=Marinobacterium nitratireducens TaxID=518897 RepID=A0A917ZA56_9GAMM|nr:DUF1302 family protein [Marinobacterium nitratireducens]GGO78907.1 hypothetical protein GCM10011348_11890 [Marinobacterium nitratireducens]